MRCAYAHTGWLTKGPFSKPALNVLLRWAKPSPRTPGALTAACADLCMCTAAVPHCSIVGSGGRLVRLDGHH